MSSPNTFRALASIMIETKNPSIYNQSRNLCMQILQCILFENRFHDVDVFNEIKAWVDGISLNTLPIFCKMLNATQKITVQHPVLISNACQELTLTNSKEQRVSSLLSTALISIAADANLFSDCFIIFVCQVTFTSLIQSMHPEVLACVVKNVLKNEYFLGRVEPVITRIDALIEYSTLIVVGDIKLLTKAHSLTSVMFHENSIFTGVASFLLDDSKESIIPREIHLDNSDSTMITASLVLRQCLHHKKLDNENKISDKKLVKTFFNLFPILIKVSSET